ncbi:MAG: alpha/beta hydrolase, partial [Caldimonas sp.]
MTAASLYRDFKSADEIDAEYKPSLRVAGAEALMRGYGERSTEARARLAGVYDVPYGPTPDEKLDIFPAARPNASVFVFIHGGYWRAFSAKDHSFVALGPVALGITTVVIDYSLCPRVTIDEITRQSRAALAWTLGHIGAHGGDPKRVAVGGHSAGAHLSA